MDIKKNYMKKFNPEFRTNFELITKTIEMVDTNLKYDVKWGKLTYAFAGDFHHWICAVASTRNSANIYFHFGGILDDKKKVLIAGSSLFLRKLEFKHKDKVDTKLVADFVAQAIDKLEYFKANWRTINNNHTSDKK